MGKIKFWLQQQLSIVNKYLEPVFVYWRSITTRERYLVILAGGVIAIAACIYIVIGAADSLSNMRQEYQSLLKYRTSVKHIHKTYVAVKANSANEFDTVNADKINIEASKILETKLPVRVILSDNVLTIKASQAKFSLLMQLLEHLRRTYGIFPLAAQITKLSTSGFVAFDISFKVNNQ